MLGAQNILYMQPEAFKFYNQAYNYEKVVIVGLLLHTLISVYSLITSALIQCFEFMSLELCS